jgi:catalase
MSDRGIPKSFRHMRLFGSHTFSMINAGNRRTWVKFHFRTQQGIQNLLDQEAGALVANDRESHGRDLLEAIGAAAAGAFTALNPSERESFRRSDLRNERQGRTAA